MATLANSRAPGRRSTGENLLEAAAIKIWMALFIAWALARRAEARQLVNRQSINEWQYSKHSFYPG